MYVQEKTATKKVMQELWSGEERESHTLSTGDKTTPILMEGNLASMTIDRKVWTVRNARGSWLSKQLGEIKHLDTEGERPASILQ